MQFLIDLYWWGGRVECNFLRSLIPVFQPNPLIGCILFDIIKIVRFCGFYILHEIFVDRAPVMKI
jgi:hypothetical protein